jgi:APA family basic amino acid/polyamine antiporter
MRLFRRKPLAQLLGETNEPNRQLKRVLGPIQLTALGVGASVGAGIFSSIGSAVAGGGDHVGAGPAIIISFLVVAVACALAGFCYAEFASMVPTSGSAYTYAYATLGELIAWIIGWDLILEYAVGNVAVAVSWSGYFQQLLTGMSVHWPAWLGCDYRSALQAAHEMANLQAAHGDLSTLSADIRLAAEAWTAAPLIGGLHIVFNLPAFLIVMVLTVILLVGIRESAWFNAAMVAVKIVIIVFFLIVGAKYIRPENWTPFAPHGLKGIAAGAAIIFFAYIGFDAVSTAAEETRDPQRNMPIGILASLVVCTIIYITVAIVLTGLMKASELGTAEPLATAFSSRGINWAAGVISLGAVVATTSVLFVFQLGQPRIFFSMARDGLLPNWAAKVHPRFKTPWSTTILTGLFVAVFAAVSNINEVVELCNIGTLFAFILVAGGILALRSTDPDRVRPFRTPLVPWVPIGAIISCALLMRELPSITWWRFFLWLAVGMILYWGAGMDESKLAPRPADGGAEPRRENFAKLLTIGLAVRLLGAGVGGAVFALRSRISDRAETISLWIAGFIIYVGVVFWVRGCGKYAFSKGYSRWWGLFGLLALAILFMLPAKQRTQTAPT